MHTLVLILLVIALLEGACLVAGYLLHREMMAYNSDERRRVWQLVGELEGDKRALTESLCRAEGKPFIPAHRDQMQASAGWWDGKPEVKVS